MQCGSSVDREGVFTSVYLSASKTSQKVRDGFE